MPLQEKRNRYRTKIGGDDVVDGEQTIKHPTDNTPSLDTGITTAKTVRLAPVAHKWDASPALHARYAGQPHLSSSESSSAVAIDSNSSESAMRQHQDHDSHSRRRRVKKATMTPTRNESSTLSPSRLLSSASSSQSEPPPPEGAVSASSSSWGSKFDGDGPVGRYQSRQKRQQQQQPSSSSPHAGSWTERNTAPHSEPHNGNDPDVFDAQDVEYGSNSNGGLPQHTTQDGPDDPNDKGESSPTASFVATTTAATAVGSRVAVDTPSAHAEPMPPPTTWLGDAEFFPSSDHHPSHQKQRKLVVTVVAVLSLVTVVVGVCLFGVYFLWDWGSETPSPAPSTSFPTLTPSISMAPSLSFLPSSFPSTFPSPLPSASFAPSDEGGGRRVPTFSPSFGGCTLCFGTAELPFPDKPLGETGMTCLDLQQQIQHEDEESCRPYQFLGHDQCDCETDPCSGAGVSCADKDDDDWDALDNAKDALEPEPGVGKGNGNGKGADFSPTTSPAPTTSIAPTVDQTLQPSGDKCFLCGDPDRESPFPDKVAVQLHSGGNLTCEELDAELQDSDSGLSKDDCLTFQAVGSLRCGCPAPPPEAECWICPDGSLPDESRLDFVVASSGTESVTCLERAVQVAGIRGNPEQCATTTETLQGVCGCAGSA